MIDPNRDDKADSPKDVGDAGVPEAQTDKPQDGHQSQDNNSVDEVDL